MITDNRLFWEGSEDVVTVCGSLAFIRVGTHTIWDGVFIFIFSFFS